MKKILLIAFTAFFVSYAPAFANEEALNRVKTSIDQVVAIVSDPSFKNPATHDAMEAKAEQIVMQLFDFSEFSARTVGRNWRNFNDDQKKRFEDAFTHLLRDTYIDSLDSYNGEHVLYDSVIEGNNGTRVEVRSFVVADNKKIPFAFRMLKKNNVWVVYDVLIENISLIKNYREQFASFLNSANPDELIAKVVEKNKEIHKK